MPEDTSAQSGVIEPFHCDSEDARARIEVLFRLRHREVVRAVLPYTRDESTAEDVAQEALLRLYQRYRLGRTVDNVVAWTLAVARNLARDLTRRRRTEDVVTPGQWEILLDTVAGESECPEQITLGREADERLRAAVQSLPRMQGACVRLYGQGRTFTEIASMQEISYYQAVTQTRYAIDRLKRILAPRPSS